MSPAEIVAAMRRAAEEVFAFDRYATVTSCGQPEELVREVAVAAGVTPHIIFYPGVRPVVIVSAHLAHGGFWSGNISFSSKQRDATAEEIAEHYRTQSPGAVEMAF